MTWRDSCVLGFLLTGCSSPLPPLAKPNAGAMQPAVRALVEQAYAEARADPLKTRRLAMILHAHQENGAAEAVYARARALDPNDAAAAYYWAQLLAARGDHKGAAGLLRGLPALPARLLLANSLRESGDAAASAGICRDLIARDAGNATAHYLLGRAAGDAGEYARALELFPRYGAARFALAALYRQRGQMEEAAKLLVGYERDKLLAPPVEDPDNAALADLAVSPTGLLRRAVREESAGRLAEAAALQRQALELEANLPDAWANLISLEARLGNDKAVEEAYARVAAGNAGAHYNYGVFCMQKQRIKDAAKAFRKAPGHADALFNLGGIAALQGNLLEASALLRQAIGAKPGFAQAHYQLGRILASQARYGPAVEEFDKAAKSASSDRELAAYLHGLGLATARAGQPAAAGEILRRALGKASSTGQAELMEVIRRDLEGSLR